MTYAVREALFVLLVSDVSFEDFQQKLLAMDRPVYAVVDFPWEDTNHQKNKTLFFVAWSVCVCVCVRAGEGADVRV